MYKKVSNNRYVSAATMLASANSSILVVDNSARQRLINQALNPSYYPINPNSDSDILHKSYMQQEQYIAEDVAHRNDIQEHGGPVDTPPSSPSPSPPRQRRPSQPPPPPSTPQSRRSGPPPPSTPQGRGQGHHQIQSSRSDPSAPRDQQRMMQNAARPTYVNGRRVRTQQEQLEHDRDLTDGLEAYRREEQRNHDHDLRNPLEVRMRALTGLSRAAYAARQSRMEADHGLASGSAANTSGVNPHTLLVAAVDAGRVVDTHNQLLQRYNRSRQDLVARHDVHMQDAADHQNEPEGSLHSNRLAMQREMNLGAAHIHSVNQAVAGSAHPARPATDMGAGPSNVRRNTHAYSALVPYNAAPDASTALLNLTVYPPPAGISSSLARVLAPSAIAIVRAPNRSTPHEYRAVRDTDGKTLEPDHPSRADLLLPDQRLVRRRVAPSASQLPVTTLQTINRNVALVLYGENTDVPSGSR